MWGGRFSVMAQQRVLPQSKETLLQSYNKRLKDDVKSIMDNFTEIIKTAKVGEESPGGPLFPPQGTPFPPLKAPFPLREQGPLSGWVFLSSPSCPEAALRGC